MKKILVLLPFLAIIIGCATDNGGSQSPVLNVEGGQIQGVQTDIPGVYAYKGIPYAAPPIGKLRWKEPQPVQLWDSVRQCDRFGHPGYQSVHYPGGYATEWGYGDEAPYSEDCLYLNVYTNAPGKVNKKLPVALWIHGGGYREGWGSEPEFDGQEWAAKDVVLVTINYRLGIFGFMTYPELSAESPNHVSGNYGILDQIQSLKWVKENIAQFGGDPENVTICGPSGGVREVDIVLGEDLNGDGIDDSLYNQLREEWQMSDYWRRGETFDPTRDYDGDGASVIAEAYAGTDPFDPEDVLRITAFSVDDAGDSSPVTRHVSLTFPTIPGRDYVVATTTNLTGAVWSPTDFYPDAAKAAPVSVLSVPSGSKSATVTVYLLPTTAPASFFRIHAE